MNKKTWIVNIPGLRPALFNKREHVIASVALSYCAARTKPELTVDTDEHLVWEIGGIEIEAEALPVFESPNHL